MAKQKPAAKSSGSGNGGNSSNKSKGNASLCNNSAAIAVAVVAVGVAVYCLVTMTATTTSHHHSTASMATGEPGLSVFDRNLLALEPTAASILNNHHIYATTTTTTTTTAAHGFHGESLSYITPWHRQGYAQAVRHAAKLTYLAPVWLQIKPDMSAASLVRIEGEQDVDQPWMAQVRASSAGETSQQHRGNGKIVPRYIVEGWSREQLMGLFAQDRVGAAAAAVCSNVKVCNTISQDVWYMLLL